MKKSDRMKKYYKMISCLPTQYQRANPTKKELGCIYQESEENNENFDALLWAIELHRNGTSLLDISEKE